MFCFSFVVEYLIIEYMSELVSVIVLNWNGRRFVDGIINSIQQQSYPQSSIEILFVDNNSSDDSVKYFSQKKVANARLIQTGDNHGYAGGNNFGFREAAGDYIVVCNNDLELHKDWLKNLVKSARKNNADVVVPKLVYADSNKINNAGSLLMPDSDWPNKERGVGKPFNDPEFNQTTEVTAFCGASPLFRRSFLEQVGMYDKRFFLYWEDGDLSWRGQKLNKKYIYEPKAVAYHHTSGSTGGETSPVFIYYVSRNRVLILLKHARFRLALRAFMVVARDHVLFKLRDLISAIRRRNGIRNSLKNLYLGIRILLGIIWSSPVMLLKRFEIIKEETL